MHKSKRPFPVILSIAGSDNTGGAGIQADIKTCMALGSYAATAVTAVTAQNPDGLFDCQYVGDKLLLSQLECTYKYLNPDAVKIGLLPNISSIRIIASFLKAKQQKNIVIDPVLSASAGGVFAAENLSQIIEEFKKHLSPIAEVITPNRKELSLLLNSDNGNFDENDINTFLEDSGTKAIIATGGDDNKTICRDELWLRGKGLSISLESKKVNSMHTHGTGCTFSTAVAVNIGVGESLENAFRKAKEFTEQCIIKGAQCPVMDKYGPVIHF